MKPSWHRSLQNSRWIRDSFRVVGPTWSCVKTGQNKARSFALPFLRSWGSSDICSSLVRAPASSCAPPLLQCFVFLLLCQYWHRGFTQAEQAFHQRPVSPAHPCSTLPVQLLHPSLSCCEAGKSACSNSHSLCTSTPCVPVAKLYQSPVLCILSITEWGSGGTGLGRELSSCCPINSLACRGSSNQKGNLHPTEVESCTAAETAEGVKMLVAYVSLATWVQSLELT